MPLTAKAVSNWLVKLIALTLLAFAAIFIWKSDFTANNGNLYNSHTTSDCVYSQNSSLSDVEEIDTCLQSRSVVAAERSAVYSSYALIVSAFGVIFSFLSTALVVLALVQGRDANRTAKDALSADRPWVGSVPFQKMNMIGGSVNDIPVRDTIGFLFQWKNWGSSPATRVKTGFAFSHVGFDEDPSGLFKVPSEFSEGFNFIGPGQQVGGGQFALQQDDIDRMRAHESALLFLRLQ